MYCEYCYDGIVIWNYEHKIFLCNKCFKQDGKKNNADGCRITAISVRKNQ